MAKTHIQVCTSKLYSVKNGHIILFMFVSTLMVLMVASPVIQIPKNLLNKLFPLPVACPLISHRINIAQQKKEIITTSSSQFFWSKSRLKISTLQHFFFIGLTAILAQFSFYQHVPISLYFKTLCYPDWLLLVSTINLSEIWQSKLSFFLKKEWHGIKALNYKLILTSVRVGEGNIFFPGKYSIALQCGWLL